MKLATRLTAGTILALTQQLPLRAEALMKNRFNDNNKKKYH